VVGLQKLEVSQSPYVVEILMKSSVCDEGMLALPICLSFVGYTTEITVSAFVIKGLETPKLRLRKTIIDQQILRIYEAFHHISCVTEIHIAVY